MPRIHSVIALAALVALAACSRDDGGDPKVAVDRATADSAVDAPLGPGDVRVTSTDGAVVLEVVGDSVRIHLSDDLRQKVQQEIDSSAKDGIGGLVARSVSGIVGSAMGFVVRIPVTEIENVRYEDGQIRFGTPGNTRIRMSGKDGDGKSSAEFTREDGERFVAAVKARQAALATPR